MNGPSTNGKKCALCECDLPKDVEVSICNDCIKNADCCVGLEKLENHSSEN
jgi:hypothetical protein